MVIPSVTSQRALPTLRKGKYSDTQALIPGDLKCYPVRHPFRHAVRHPVRVRAYRTKKESLG